MKAIFSILILIASFVSTAHAGGFARGLLGYTSDQAGQTNPDKTTVQQINLSGGWKSQEGWTIHGAYAMETRTVTTAGTTSIYKRTSYGPGVGYMSSGAVGGYIGAVYYYNSEYVDSGLTYKGSGYGVDGGLKVAVSQIFILAGFSYEYFSYAKTNVGVVSPERKETHISPRIGLEFDF